MRHTILPLTSAAVLLACSYRSDDCRNTLTCETPHAVEPYCDGVWRYTREDGSICDDPTECVGDQCCPADGVCDYCPVLDANGIWRFPGDPSRTWDVREPELRYLEGLDCTSTDAAGAAGQGGAGGAANAAGATSANGGVAGAEVVCNGGATAAPDETGCAVDNAIGVFVAPHGSSTSAGTLEDPLSSVSVALTRASEQGLDAIYVCAERDGTSASYTESVELVDATGVSIYGGFDCSEDRWRYDTELRATFLLDAGESWLLQGVTDVELLDLAIVASTPENAGENSIALSVVESTGVTLTRSRFESAEATDGLPGSLEAFSYEELATLDGNSAVREEMTGGAGKECTCDNGIDSIGGLGGSAVAGGQSGSVGLPTLAIAGGQAGQAATACGSSGTGGNGAPGASAAAALGAALLGGINALAWIPASGFDGENGGTAQGGGGGGSSSASGGGGGGACGGCGGAGAIGGGGGGASIAVLSISSDLTITQSILVSADGGNGGAGASGQPGQENDVEAGIGGIGGTPVGTGCAGGHGGPGGDGGASGGGAGGLSVNLLWIGEVEPNVDVDSEFEVGAPGAGGEAAAGEDNSGVSGRATDILDAASL